MVDTVWDLLNGTAGVGDVTWDIREDVVFKTESNTDDKEKAKEDSNKGAGKSEQLPEIKYPGNDPTKNPGEGWEWKGKGEQGSSEGSYTKPETGESLHPDLEHSTEGKGIGPHWDYNYRGSGTKGWRIFPDGKIEPK